MASFDRFRKSTFLCLVLLLLLPSGTNAQQPGDTLLLQADTVSVVVRDHSPTKASIYSAVFPGLGQIYNRKYWKVPIVYAGFGTLVYFVIFNTDWLGRYTSAYLDFTDTIPGTDSYLDLISKNLDPATFDPVLHPDTYSPGLAESFKKLLINNREYYRRNRDLSYIGFAAWYLLTIVDASVDAHFYDFDISDDLSLQVKPFVTGPGAPVQVVGMRATLNF